MIMMGLHWLKIDRHCILEIPQLKDYAGQALVFRPPGLLVRCVTTEVFEHPLVKAYKDQLLLVEVDGNGAVIAAVPAPAPAPAPAKSTVAVPEKPPAPAVVAPEPEKPPAPAVVAPEPEKPTTPAVTDDATPDGSSSDESPAKEGDEGKGFELKRRRR